MQRDADKVELARLLLASAAGDDVYVFVCGGTAMGAQVHEAFVRVLTSSASEGEGGAMTNEEAIAHLKSMQQKKTYVQELWSV